MTRPSAAHHARKPQPRGPRPDLSRDKILAAALGLIDTQGLGALNMRDLGLALGATTMAVYRHFASKAELLDAVVDRVVEGFAPAPAAGPWQEQARTSCLKVRNAMLAHPELADLIGRELRRSSTSLKVNIEIIERLRATGVPPVLLPDVYWALSSYTTGYALLEAQAHRHRRANEPPTPRTQRIAKLAAMLAPVGGVSEQAREDAARVLSRPLDDEQFLFGLDCLIRGLEGKVAAAGSA